MKIELAGSPYLLYDILGEGVLEQFYDLAVIYHVEGVTFI